MPKYRVYLETVAGASIVVEADDADAAVDAACDELPNLCAQCSGWGQSWSLELGDEWESDASPPDLVDDEESTAL